MDEIHQERTSVRAKDSPLRLIRRLLNPEAVRLYSSELVVAESP